MTIMIICNVNPDNNVVINGLGGYIRWKELKLVQDVTTLNIVCGVATGCLLVSWILDILCQNVSDNGGVYHAAWRDVAKPRWSEILEILRNAGRKVYCCCSSDSEDEDAEVDAHHPDQETRL